MLENQVPGKEREEVSKRDNEEHFNNENDNL